MNAVRCSAAPLCSRFASLLCRSVFLAPLPMSSRAGAGDPENGLADGEAAEDGGVFWVGVEGAPEGGVLGPTVGASGEEQGGAAARKIVEEAGVGGVGPGAAILDKDGVTGDGDAEAGTVLKLDSPKAFEASGEEVAGGAEEIEVEEGVAVAVGAGELVGEGAVAEELGAEGDGLEVMAEVGEGGVVGVEAGEGSALEQPGAPDVVFAVAGEAGMAGGGEPFEEGGKPGFGGGEGFGREGFGAGEEGDGYGDLGEAGGFGDAFGVATGCRA